MIKGTHGLPCAHKITEFIRDGHPIPLLVAQPHWMKLDLMKGKINVFSFNLNIESELDKIRVHFVTSDESGKLTLKKSERIR